MEQTEDKESYIKMLKYLLVCDLRDLLAQFNKLKTGKKSILFKRAKELLDSGSDEIYSKIKDLYNARFKVRNEKISGNEIDKSPNDFSKTNSNLVDQKENDNSINNQESSEIETVQNTGNVEPSLADVQNRLENLETNDLPACQNEKNTDVAPANSVLRNRIICDNLNVILNNQANNNSQTLIQNASSLNIQRIGQVLANATNLMNRNEQFLIDQNISNISNSIQSMRVLFDEKFKQMDGFKYLGELEEATMLISRPKVTFRTVIKLNKIKTMDVDFTNFYHVNRMILADFFLNKKYEIHLRIACDPLKILVPPKMKIFINHQRYFYFKSNNFISINLTRHFLHQFKTFNPLYLEIAETDVRKKYFCGIYLFRKLSTAEIKENQCFGLDNNLNKVDYVKNRNLWEKINTISMLKEKLNPSLFEFEIVTDYIKISLICPLTKLRIKIPSRGKKCQHIQCFDLESYIALNEKSEKWSCPLCDKLVIYSDIVIDSLIKQIVDETKCDEVNLDINGKWTELNSESSSEASFTDTIIISEKDNSCIILD